MSLLHDQPKGPEDQDSLFLGVDVNTTGVPPELARATQRLQFPPSYVVVGAYRLFTDKALYIPVWDKCRQGTLRGSLVGLVWVSAISGTKSMRDDSAMPQTFLTFGIQKKFIQVFLAK